MNLRRRNKDAGEIHAGTLNDILFILLFFFLILSTLANPNIVKVNNPKGTGDTKAKQNITVSIDKDNRFFIGQTEVSREALDTLLKAEIIKAKAVVDTPTVVINADTLTHFGDFIKVATYTKTQGANPVFSVKP